MLGRDAGLRHNVCGVGRLLLLRAMIDHGSWRHRPHDGIDSRAEIGITHVIGRLTRLRTGGRALRDGCGVRLSQEACH
jgi:hypothetical protein